MVITCCSASGALSFIHFSHAGKRPVSLVSQMPMKPRRFASASEVRPEAQVSPGVNGAAAGDLYLRVRLRPHRLFRVEGRDVHLDLPVAPWEAVLGATVEVPTLRGSSRVKVPPGSSSGRRLRLRGEGMPDRSGPGDLYAAVRIVVPQRPSRKERSLYEHLAEESSFDPRKGWPP